jgi:hypothetical protein
LKGGNRLICRGNNTILYFVYAEKDESEKISVKKIIYFDRNLSESGHRKLEFFNWRIIMKIFENYKINAIVIIVIALTVFMVVSLYFLMITEDVKISSIFGSLVAGLIVAIIQFIIAWRDYMQTEKLKELGLKKIIYNKHDTQYYAECMNKAEREIWVMGTTAARFFDDFADNVLLNKLKQGVLVKVLLTDEKYLEKERIFDFQKTKQHIVKIKAQFPSCQLYVKYLEHEVSHSIFVVDDTCIIGPVFPKMRNKEIPALHVNNSTPIAKKYLDYFKNEWENAHE